MAQTSEIVASASCAGWMGISSRGAAVVRVRMWRSTVSSSPRRLRRRMMLVATSILLPTMMQEKSREPSTCTKYPMLKQDVRSYLLVLPSTSEHAASTNSATHAVLVSIEDD